MRPLRPVNVETSVHEREHPDRLQVSYTHLDVRKSKTITAELEASKKCPGDGWYCTENPFHCAAFLSPPPRPPLSPIPQTW